MLGLTACESKSSHVIASGVERAGASAASLTRAAEDTLRASQATTGSPPETPLRLAYSKDPGAAEWSTLARSPSLTRHGAMISVTEYEPVAALEALAGGRVDAVATTNADVLVNRSLGVPCTVITPTWVSRGAEVLLASKDVPSVAALRGRVIGVELGRPEHLWLEHTLREHGLASHEVRIVNLVPQLASETLSDRAMSAVALSYPESASRLNPDVHGLASSSKSEPFLYGVLCVAPASVQTRASDWSRVVLAWTEMNSTTRSVHTTAAEAAVLRKLVAADDVPAATLIAATALLDEFFVRTRVYLKPSLSREDFVYQTVP